MNEYEILQDLLCSFFSYEEYYVAIRTIKSHITDGLLSWERWLKASNLIKERKLLPGQPLTLVQEAANQVLDENTDEEAYRWLEGVIRNVERTDEIIEAY